jgi:hypothetical protein
MPTLLLDLACGLDLRVSEIAVRARERHDDDFFEVWNSGEEKAGGALSSPSSVKTQPYDWERNSRRRTFSWQFIHKLSISSTTFPSSAPSAAGAASSFFVSVASTCCAFFPMLSK